MNPTAHHPPSPDPRRSFRPDENLEDALVWNCIDEAMEKIWNKFGDEVATEWEGNESRFWNYYWDVVLEEARILASDDPGWNYC